MIDMLHMLAAATLALSSPGEAIAPNTLSPALARVSPAVVKLYGTGMGRAHGYGTGVLVSADGNILTTRSLLSSAETVRVVLSDGREFEGKSVRNDEYRELALLKIDGKDLPFITPSKTDHLQVGDAVAAIGNWFKVADGDEAPSVNRGILSTRTTLNARRLVQPVDYAGPILVYDAITANPGAAGGPLMDIDGNFVGLVGKVVESADTNTRLNYALPGEELSDFLGNKASEATATTQRSAPGAEADIGVRLSRMGYRHVSAYIDRVRPGSPAASAGLRGEDLIVAIDGRRIADAEACEEAIRRLMPGQKATLVVKRGSEFLNIDVVPEKKTK